MTLGLEGEKLQSTMRRSPLRRLATPEDVEGAVAYLLGPDSAAVTGTILTVDAGSTRSEERRVGKECVSTCRYRWSPYNYNNNKTSNNTKTQPPIKPKKTRT